MSPAGGGPPRKLSPAEMLFHGLTLIAKGVREANENEAMNLCAHCEKSPPEPNGKFCRECMNKGLGTIAETAASIGVSLVKELIKGR